MPDPATQDGEVSEVSKRVAIRLGGSNVDLQSRGQKAVRHDAGAAVAVFPDFPEGRLEPSRDRGQIKTGQRCKRLPDASAGGR
jgi:hypothetical protein